MRSVHFINVPLLISNKWGLLDIAPVSWNSIQGEVFLTFYIAISETIRDREKWLNGKTTAILRDQNNTLLNRYFEEKNILGFFQCV